MPRWANMPRPSSTQPGDEAARRTLGPRIRETLGILSELAAIYQMQGNYALAETSATQVLAGSRHALGNEVRIR